MQQRKERPCIKQGLRLVLNFPFPCLYSQVLGFQPCTSMLAYAALGVKSRASRALSKHWASAVGSPYGADHTFHEQPRTCNLALLAGSLITLRETIALCLFLLQAPNTPSLFLTNDFVGKGRFLKPRQVLSSESIIAQWSPTWDDALPPLDIGSIWRHFWLPHFRKGMLLTSDVEARPLPSTTSKQFT